MEEEEREQEREREQLGNDGERADEGGKTGNTLSGSGSHSGTVTLTDQVLIILGSIGGAMGFAFIGYKVTITNIQMQFHI